MRRALLVVGFFALCNLPIVVLGLASLEAGTLMKSLPVFLSEPIIAVPLITSNALFALAMWSSRSTERGGRSLD